MTATALADAAIGVILLGILLYGAVWDARKRLIPDKVPLAVMAVGIIICFMPNNSFWNVPLSERMAGLVLPAAAMLVLHLLGKPVGGGDFKLTAALGFLLGLTQFAVAYAIAAILALIWAAVKKRKSVPLAVFLAIGVVLCLIL